MSQDSPNLPQPRLTPTEETTPQRPHGHRSSGTCCKGSPQTTRSLLLQHLCMGIACFSFKATGIFLDIVFSESAPVIGLHLMLLLALPEVRGTCWCAVSRQRHLEVTTVWTQVPWLQLRECCSRQDYHGPESEDVRLIRQLVKAQYSQKKGLWPAQVFKHPMCVHHPLTTLCPQNWAAS